MTTILVGSQGTGEDPKVCNGQKRSGPPFYILPQGHVRYFPPDQDAIPGCPFYFLTRLKKTVIVLIVHCIYIVNATGRPQVQQHRELTKVGKDGLDSLEWSWTEK